MGTATQSITPIETITAIAMVAAMVAATVAARGLQRLMYQ